MAPKPPGLSPDELRAVADKEAGRPYNSTKQKMIDAEKYKKERNKRRVANAIDECR
jgi:hypothetical protein